MRLWLLFKKKKKLGKESMQSESLFKEAEWAEKWAGFIKSLQYLVRILYRFFLFIYFFKKKHKHRPSNPHSAVQEVCALWHCSSCCFLHVRCFGHFTLTPSAFFFVPMHQNLYQYQAWYFIQILVTIFEKKQKTKTCRSRDLVLHKDFSP